MEEIFLLALVNPLAITTYAGELGELSDEFGALEPRDESLALAHSELSGRIELVLAAVENPSLSALPRIPTLIAEIQVASRAFSDESWDSG